jgi:thymidylate synthase (FAD)
MTKQSEILSDPRYIPIHNGGFVGLIETMGSDETIERAARVSYGKGTRIKSDTRNLIRYLIRNQHTSPTEFGEVVLHVKLPIFVARQWMRHRTFSYNETSLRYSEAETETYIPTPEYIQRQSTTNKQGREGTIEDPNNFINDINLLNVHIFDTYNADIEEGVSRELARINLPLSLYTEFYCKVDLNNLMRFLKLRMDPHAQMEIQDYANAICSLVRPKFPIIFEAFDDYMINAESFSSQEMQILRAAVEENKLIQLVSNSQLSDREKKELLEKLKTSI